MKQEAADHYPLLREYLSLKELPLKAAFTVRQVAQMFDVTTRSIQSWIAIGKLNTRDVPGRAKIFPVDLEELLARSRQPDPAELQPAGPTTGPRPMPRQAGSFPVSTVTAKRIA